MQRKVIAHQFGLGPAVVSNMCAAQRAGTQLVDFYYDLADADRSTLTAITALSTNGGASYTLAAHFKVAPVRAWCRGWPRIRALSCTLSRPALRPNE